MSRRSKILWTVGNLLMLIGLYLLLFVGGLLADEQYNLWAASGDSGIPLAEPVDAAPIQPPQANNQIPTEEDETQGWRLPQLNNPGQGTELNTLIPEQTIDWGPNTVTRIQIPRIKVDRKVQEVGWRTEVQNGVQVAVWDVSKYAVGHHKATANPGQAGNIVMAGHSGGQAYPFNDLFYLETGDHLILWSNQKPYTYTVERRLVLDELGPTVTEEQRRDNAKYIGPTTTEQVTLVTCWPLKDTPEAKKFSQRVVIQAVPITGDPTSTPGEPTTTPTISTSTTSSP